MSDFIPGVRDTFSGDDADVILDLSDGLNWLNQRNDGIELLRRIGLNGFTYANQKHEWAETQLAVRSEIVTLANDSATSLDVSKSGQYQVNELLLIENEVVRVTAIADSNTLTIVRGYSGTTAAAHSSKKMISLGSADPEGANAPAGITDDGDLLYNYNQNFTRAVEMSRDEIAQLSTEPGDPMDAQLERRFIELNRQLLQAFLYGRRHQDATNKIYAMGGCKQFYTTNVTNVAGAVSVANVDALILSIVLAGGDPKIIGVSPNQKQKLDALDNSKQMLGKREHTGGGLMIETWQSGVLDHPLDIVVDPTFNTDELWIWDTDHVKIGHKENNGVSGSFKVYDATTPGADRKSTVIRGKYSAKFGLEKSGGYLYALT